MSGSQGQVDDSKPLTNPTVICSEGPWGAASVAWPGPSRAKGSAHTGCGFLAPCSLLGCEGGTLAAAAGADLL